ncbi:MAG: hypothetical protein L0154_17045 [Chloroflexi bacterium]|nr:hypothetical protein [Chloroflexota bacterium]
MLHRRIFFVLGVIFAIATVGVSLIDVDDSSPIARFDGVPSVEASCTVVLNANPYIQDEDDNTQELILIITTPEGEPLVGVCLTFTRDTGPGGTPEVVGTCTTDEDGVCSIVLPEGIINVHFGNTRIGGIPVTNAQDTVNALVDASVGGVSYYHEPGEEPAEEHIVANQNDDGTGIVMEHAHEDEEGNLVPFDPGDEAGEGGLDDWGDWTLPDIDLEPAPWITDPIINTQLPEGIVTVRFTPSILRTSGSYAKTYCYYSTTESGYTRSPEGDGAFLPGGGGFFDLGAVLSGDARPAMVLEAETEEFFITFECWGWSGDDLVKIGTAGDSQPRELWLGQPLQMSGSGIAIEYALLWIGPELEPASPRLVVEDTEIIDGLVRPGLEGVPIAANQTRFSDELTAPSNVVFEEGTLTWTFNGDNDDIGGFRIFRNGYLVGVVSPTARGWQGDGLEISECGDTIEYKVTSFLGGQESVPSSAATADGEACEATITVTFDILELSEMIDCDGEYCAEAAEGYGWMAVNDTLINFGAVPNYIGLENANSYSLGSFDGTTSVITIDVGANDTLSIEFGLFDHDSATADDLICAIQEILPSRDAEGWQGQNGRRITRSATGTEGTCQLTFQIDVAVD